MDEEQELRRKLPELKIEYSGLLRRDDIASAEDVRAKALEVFDEIQQLERLEFLDSLSFIARSSTVGAVDLAERLLAGVLKPKVGGRSYESVAADGSVCVIMHEGVVPIRRFGPDRMRNFKKERA